MDRDIEFAIADIFYAQELTRAKDYDRIRMTLKDYETYKVNAGTVFQANKKFVIAYLNELEKRNIPGWLAVQSVERYIDYNETEPLMIW